MTKLTICLQSRSRFSGPRFLETREHPNQNFQKSFPMGLLRSVKHCNLPPISPTNRFYETIFASLRGSRNRDSSKLTSKQTQSAKLYRYIYVHLTQVLAHLVWLLLQNSSSTLTNISTVKSLNVLTKHLTKSKSIEKNCCFLGESR